MQLLLKRGVLKWKLAGVKQALEFAEEQKEYLESSGAVEKVTFQQCLGHLQTDMPKIKNLLRLFEGILNSTKKYKIKISTKFCIKTKFQIIKFFIFFLVPCYPI